MIHRRSSSSLVAQLAAWLAMAALGATVATANDEPAKPTSAPAAQPNAAAKEAPAKAPAPAPAAAADKSAGKAEGTVAAKSKPDDIEGLLKLGPSLAERGDFEASEIALRQVLNTPGVKDYDLKTALLSLAHMHRRKGELTKAVAIYERFLKDYPGDDRTPDALLDLGRTLRSLGTYKLAMARFYSVINSTLKLPTEGFDRYQVLAKTAQFEIAETHFMAGDFADANKFYTRLSLLELAPVDRARAQFKAAYSLRLQGKLEPAAASLRVFIEQHPADENVPEARYLLAVTLRELKRPQDAFNATLELLRTEKSRIAADPKRWSYWQRRTGNQLANDFFEAGDTLNARAIYAGLLELSTEAAWRLPITYQLGLCYERLGLTDRARMSYQAIVDGAGATPPPDLAELVKMSGWRIEHLAWRERTVQEITAAFETVTGKPAASAPTAAASTPATQAKAAATP